MARVPNVNTVMLSGEAAKFLGISVQKLNRLRRDKKLHGTQVGKSKLYTYTIADLKQADLTKKKTGPKHPRNQYSKKVETGT